MSKSVFLYRAGAFGDHIHMSNVIKAFDEDGWDITFCYNWKGAQIHSFNPRIKNHEFFEASAKNITSETKKLHNDRLKQAKKDFDRFVSFQNSLEQTLIFNEADPAYFWPHWLRRKRSADICFYDQSMIWAGLTNEKYMGWSGEYWNKREDHKYILNQLKPYQDKFIILWAIRGSMWQKAVCHLAKPICDEWLKRHPDTVIITTGDAFCHKWEWQSEQGKTISPEKGIGEDAALVHKSGRMPFRQAALMSRYVDLVVTPETGLGIVAGSFGTPKIMMLTAASLKSVVGNDNNDYSIQSDAYCSPCYRAIYNTDNCLIGPGRMAMGVIKDEIGGKGKQQFVNLPICVEFNENQVLERMEEVFAAKHARIWQLLDDEVYV